MHAFEVLAGIEGLSGELAAQRITDQEFAEIRALHYEMMASVARADVSAYYRLNAAIHAALNSAAKNPVLTETFQRINNREIKELANAVPGGRFGLLLQLLARSNHSWLLVSLAFAITFFCTLYLFLGS